jgi:hypothetical protein
MTVTDTAAPRDRSGQLELMPDRERLERLGQLSDDIEEALGDGPLYVTALLDKVASTGRIAISQVKYGLEHARFTRKTVVVDQHGAASLAGGTGRPHLVVRAIITDIVKRHTASTDTAAGVAAAAIMTALRLPESMPPSGDSE